MNRLREKSLANSIKLQTIWLGPQRTENEMKKSYFSKIVTWTRCKNLGNIFTSIIFHYNRFRYIINISYFFLKINSLIHNIAFPSSVKGSSSFNPLFLTIFFFFWLVFLSLCYSRKVYPMFREYDRPYCCTVS